MQIGMAFEQQAKEEVHTFFVSDGRIGASLDELLDAFPVFVERRRMQPGVRCGIHRTISSRWPTTAKDAEEPYAVPLAEAELRLAPALASS